MRRTYGKDPLYGLLLTFGAALVIEELIRVIWGARERSLPLPEAISGATLVGDLIYSKYRFFACAFAVALILLLWLFIEKTRVGAIIKAGAHDSEMVRALGIDLSRIWLLVFGIGTGLAGLAGILAGPMRGVYAEMGVTMVIESFVVIVVGGMGSLVGAVVAGLLMGQVVGLTTYFAPALAEIMVFVAMAVVLLVRPSGLFGEAGLLD